MEKMIVEELQNCLKAHEQRILERKGVDIVTKQALQARKTNSRTRGKGWRGFKGRFR